MKAGLGVMFTGASGKAANAVFRETSEGTIVGPRVTPRNPRTPAQQAVRAAMTKASQSFQTLTQAQIKAWNKYALKGQVNNKTTHKPKTRSGINAYLELASKYYLVNGSGTAPATPPALPFVADDVTFTVTASAGTLTVTASGPNNAGVKTEFLIQELASPARKPQKGGYRTNSYHAFVAGTLDYDIEVDPGYYAVGYRFVNTATGQQTLTTYFTDIQQVALALSKKKVA